VIEGRAHGATALAGVDREMTMNGIGVVVVPDPPAVSNQMKIAVFPSR
jgi:hypothetical protein